MNTLTRRLALSMTLLTTSLAPAADLFGLAPEPAPAPAPAPVPAPEGGWVMERVLPYVGAVVYPLARGVMALENRPRALDADEVRLASKVFAGFAARDRATLIRKMRIRYRAPMRTPWSEFQKMKSACESPPERLGAVARALAKSSFMGMGPCDLLSFVEARGWTDYLPQVSAGAQALGPEIYLGAARSKGDARQRETLFHEMEHVKQWWESYRGSSDLRRDMGMGYQYFQAHVQADFDYSSNRFEADAREAAGRLAGRNQVRP